MDTNPSNLQLVTANPPANAGTQVYGANYMPKRTKWSRPQAMLWSDNAGTIMDNVRFPLGIEKEDFLILSDHNRGEMSIAQQRIETRQRMINGTMRSYFIANKINISVAWNRLPSRSFSRNVIFDQNGNPVESSTYTEYTADAGAGGVEILDWYENHSGPFYVYLAYDKYNNASFQTGGAITDASFNYLSIYNDVRLMFFSSFDYSIEKRGANNFDFWNINVSLEEV